MAGMRWESRQGHSAKINRGAGNILSPRVFNHCGGQLLTRFRRNPARHEHCNTPRGKCGHWLDGLLNTDSTHKVKPQQNKQVGYYEKSCQHFKEFRQHAFSQSLAGRWGTNQFCVRRRAWGGE